MHKRFIRTLAVLLACAFALGCSALQAQPSSKADKVKHLLDVAGIKYNTINDTVWTVDKVGDSLGKFKVIITHSDSIVIMFVILARKAGINDDKKLLITLLHADYNYDYAKIGFNDDSDLVVIIQAPLRLIDGGELRDEIDLIANVSEDLYPKIKEFVER
jgi:hypothetical protein